MYMATMGKAFERKRYESRGRKRVMKIPFSPPDITEAEINEVVDALRSGWITTGVSGVLRMVF